MKESFRCGLAKLRRKKIPNLLLGICIITAILSLNALIFLKELNGIFDRAYEEMEGPQMCCLWNREIVSSDSVKQYMKNSKNDLEYQITENTKTVEYIEKDGIRLSNGILLELPEHISREMISPKISDKSEPEMPKKGEIWITTKMANILNAKVGDNISLQLADQSENVKVVKIVADPVFGGSNTNVYRMWCGYDRLSEFALAENHMMCYLEIRFQEFTQQSIQNFIRNAEEYFQMPLGDTLYTYDQIKSGYTSVYQMIGAVLCFVSIILSVTIIILTVFLIKSDMDEDVRTIGIYKAIGMTGIQITSVYIICYGLIGLVCSALGSVLGGKLSQKIIESILGDLGIYMVSLKGILGYQFFVWLAVSATIVFICFCAVSKIQRLNASYAIRRGNWKTKEISRKKQKNTYYNGKGSFELYYAIKGIWNKKLRYIYIIGVSMIFSCLTVLCFGCLNAVENIDKEPEAWGFIRSDIYVTSLEDTPVSNIIKELEEDSKVDYTYGVNKVYPKYKPDDAECWQSVVAEVYELPWNEKIKDKSLYGRRPQKENEIGVGMTFAEEYGLNIGEKIELFINGEKKKYEITGIFQSLSNYGKIIRMVTDNLDQFVNADGTYGDYMLLLTEPSEKWNYAKELTKKYNEEFAFIASKSNGENITGILVPAVGSILTILLIIIMIIMVNLTFLLIRKEQNLIGLLKAVGMTSWQILKIYLWRNCVSAFVGTCLGSVIGTLIVPSLLTPYAKILGLTEFPFMLNLAGLLGSLILLPVCILLATCAVVRTIRAISVKQLVNE